MIILKQICWKINSFCWPLEKVKIQQKSFECISEILEKSKYFLNSTQVLRVFERIFFWGGGGNQVHEHLNYQSNVAWDIRCFRFPFKPMFVKWAQLAKLVQFDKFFSIATRRNDRKKYEHHLILINNIHLSHTTDCTFGFSLDF